MESYKTTAPFYDDIFPLNRDKITFVKSLLGGKKGSILDAGCATGELLVTLSKEGIDVTGIDVNDDMLNIAAGKISSLNLSAKLKNLSILDIGTEFIKSRFILLLCLGNTLSHLKDINEIFDFLKQAYMIIQPGGKIAIQIINYNRILEDDIRELPVIDNEKIRFERKYNIRPDNKVEFNTKLYIKAVDRTFENSTLQFPICRNEMVRLMLNAGFFNIVTYADFKFNFFSKNDISVIFSGDR